MARMKTNKADVVQSFQIYICDIRMAYYSVVHK